MHGNLVVIVVLVLAAGSGPRASAEDPDGVPIIASGQTTGDGWVSFKVSTDGSRFGWDVIIDGAASPKGAGAALYYPNGTTVEWPFQFAGVLAGDKGGVHGGSHIDPGIDVQDPIRPVTWHPTVDQHVEILADAGSDFGLIVYDVYNNNTEVGRFVGEFRLLIYFAGGDQYEWHLRGDPGTVLLAQAAGQGAFIWDERAYRGTLNAHVYDGTGLTSASFVADASNSIDVAQRLVIQAPVDVWISCGFAFCSFGSALNWDGGLRADTPTGPRICPCRWADFVGPNAMDAGRYVFHLDKFEAGIGDSETYVVGVVNPRLPE